ncbi:hypothetical protein Kpol_1044p17 [Vanderwaltozyma polyspora DSM 70294]|uniref:Uncharacterized protein n=1 Tax=Vanderwaltozyma polyspora (strain ATCC 22028 / DSM 70294 / BCRC 21397 / CBS 2163 / NBRC 10782 / NRRL Y-8283 / UCD 57-17) TaxID=436907 RepID=A7TP48_VANPO|nr:uncharacterized protein Kpol_1044p17 [Vanderwaltozyma polyspora DSM 70294]EDO15958.1 hypothetical protein Kpol_1044p17 [Vanderwaltozyma polyspora DSM 70294]
MAVTKKKRSQYSKKQHQQHLQEAKYNFLNQRLLPENISTIIHDESDTISYRSYLLKNFNSMSRNISVLLLNNNKEIIKPNLKFNTSLINKDYLAKQKLELEKINEKLNDEGNDINMVNESLKDFYNKQLYKLNEINLLPSDSNDDNINSVLNSYLEKFNFKSQDNNIKFYPKEKFNHFKNDTNEAPADYWTNLYKSKKEEQKKKDLEALRLQEEQKRREDELKRIQKEELEQKQREEEAQKKLHQQQQEVQKQTLLEEQQKQQQMQQQKQQQMQDDQRQQENQNQNHSTSISPLVPTNVPQQPSMPSQIMAQAQLPDQDSIAGQQKVGIQIESKDIQQQDSQLDQNSIQLNDDNLLTVDKNEDNSQSQNDNLDPMFADFGNEPFTTEFDEEFGDLDAAFF